MKRKASTTKNNGHAKFEPFFCIHSMNNPLTFGVTDELERNVFLKIQTKTKMKLEPGARIVMWRWLMLTLTERVMHQKLKSKLEQVD